METRSGSSVALLADVGGDDFHVGDEAMLAANVALLSAAVPSASLKVLGRRATDAEIDAAVAAATGALLSGGGNLSDTWPELVKQRLAFFDAAARHDVPLVTGGQTLGPALSGELGRRVGERLAGASLVGVREVPSLQLAEMLGVPAERLNLQVDDAFSLSGEAPVDPAVLRASEDPFLAVTLDASYASPLAAQGMGRLATQLSIAAKTFGLGIIFVPHVGALGERRGPDIEAGQALGILVRMQGVPFELSPVPTVSEAVWLAQRATLVVSSRYHPIVFAAAAAVPALGLSRDPYTAIKLTGALAHVGAERWHLPTAAAEAGALLPALRALWASAAEVRATMAAAAPPIRDARRALTTRMIGALGLTPAISAAGPTTPALSIAVATATSAATIEPMSAPSGTNEFMAAPALDTTPPPASEVSSDLTEEQWDQFSRDGFLHLGPVLDADAIERLKQRADDLAYGRLTNPHILMQLDTGGAYDELPEAVDSFAEGTRMYRKIQGLEFDDEFIGLVRTPRFFEACARIYGPHVPLSIFRAMVMNKPAGQGTVLPWHQDGGEVWKLDREPLVTIWIALDPATTANGCMEAVRGSHRLGLLTRFGSTVSEEHAALHCPPEKVVPLEVPAGHAVLMHNWLIHRSGVNPSPVPRRAVTICYLDGRTRQLQTGDLLPVVAGTVDPTPSEYVAFLQNEAAALREAARSSEEYALSLAANLELVRESQANAERYALSLEHERQKLEAALLAASGGA